MSTTTIRLPPDLKRRVQEAAESAGTTAHAFIVEAIAEKAEQHARQRDFDATANQRYAKIIATGQTIPWSEMRRYLEARGKGKKLAPPAARKLAD